MSRKPPPIGDGWYESEEPTRLGMVTELQRIKRRMKVRPLPVLLLAVFLTAAVTYKVATKPHVYQASIVLAINEGSVASEFKRTIPFDQLKDYVASVLLPDAKIVEIINRDSPRRIAAVGAEFAIEDFRGHMEVEIWKNSFVFYADEESNAKKSARIGLEVSDLDPDRAYHLAQELAGIIIKSHEEQRRKVSTALAQEVAMMRESTATKLEELSSLIAIKTDALDRARREGRNQSAATLIVELAQLDRDEKRMTEQARQIAASPEGSADLVTAAGLDMSIEVVDARRPDRPEQSPILMVMLMIVVATIALVLSALSVGAFDSRVHDTDDVTRLGLPILGHVPGFPGDHVGSLEARGAARARVPSFLRWRSHR